MTPRPPPAPAPGPAQDRQRLVTLQEDCYEPVTGWFGPADDAGQAPRPGRAEPGGRTDQPSPEGALDGWDGSGPEAA